VHQVGFQYTEVRMQIRQCGSNGLGE